MGSRRGLGLCGQFHQSRHIDLRRRRAARAVALDTGESMLGIAFAPARDLHPPEAQLLCNRLVLLTLGRQQNDTSALHQPDAGQLGANQSGELATLPVAQHNGGGNSHAISPASLVAKHETGGLFISSFKIATPH